LFPAAAPQTFLIMGLMELFKSYDKKKRRSHFKNLFAIANADGNIDNDELDLLIRLAEKFHMSTAEVTGIIKDPSRAETVDLKTREERIEHFYDLITVMLIDGQIDKRELSMCKTFAAKLGFEEPEIDPLTRDLIEKAMNGISPEATVENILKKYR
jgi:uncharacterized tellurite resistance protein B-like protein